MKAMVLDRIVDLETEPRPLSYRDVPEPVIASREVLIQITACGVCHTELDEIEGRTPPPRLPVILGHQAVGSIAAVGPEARQLKVGQRVGVAWIFSACGRCDLCRQGLENLCARFQATGRDAHGGYAQYMKVDEEFAHLLPEALEDIQAAPLLCAGAIGYRSLRLTGIQNGQRLGLTGFGASAHLVLKLAQHQYPESPVYVFARSPQEQSFAMELGAAWAGDIEVQPPELLHAIIDTTPAWRPIVAALDALAPGGRLVINAIRKESRDQEVLLKLDYARHLWQEKEIKSVANVSRRDVREFLELAAHIPILPEVQTYPLTAANEALVELKQRKIRGAKVLLINA
ncbi:MAG: zinc-dependent alcohol dehydrogenase family protein [Desulfobacteraceae bacterium]|nr:zinc-dependent alcohol dehydrogenase family protein [Desulfobacteraceae bacterium]